jgi:hypothetical protein
MAFLSGIPDKPTCIAHSHREMMVRHMMHMIPKDPQAREIIISDRASMTGSIALLIVITAFSLWLLAL